MKSEGPRRTRGYQMTARAEQAAQTGERILDAAFDRLATGDIDDLTLAAVAADAGVTVQTVIRRFGGKDGLVAALVEREGQRISAERVPAEGEQSTLVRAVHALVGHYEKDGQLVLNLLRQEARSELVAGLLAGARAEHEQWAQTYCKELLTGARGPARKRRLAAAIAATDIYVWKLLRLDRGMGRDDVEKIMLTLLEGLGTSQGER